MGGRNGMRSCLIELLILNSVYGKGGMEAAFTRVSC